MTEQLVIHSTVVKVEERKRAVRGYIDAKGDMQIDYEGIGWFLVLVGNVAFGVGNERPPFNDGDAIDLIFRKPHAA